MADQVEVKLNCPSLKRAAPHQEIQESPPKKKQGTKSGHNRNILWAIKPRLKSVLCCMCSFQKLPPTHRSSWRTCQRTSRTSLALPSMAQVTNSILPGHDTKCLVCLL